MTTTAKSHLFYQSRLRRPMLDQARGGLHCGTSTASAISTGRRARWSATSAIPTNACWRRCAETDREKSTFGYRLHFETEPAERLAARTAALAPADMDKVFFVSARIGGGGKRHQARPPERHCHRRGATLEGDLAPAELSWFHAGSPGADRLRPLERCLRSDDAADAEDPGAARLSRSSGPGRRGDGSSLCRHAGTAHPRRGA